MLVLFAVTRPFVALLGLWMFESFYGLLLFFCIFQSTFLSLCICLAYLCGCPASPRGCFESLCHLLALLCSRSCICSLAFLSQCGCFECLWFSCSVCSCVLFLLVDVFVSLSSSCASLWSLCILLQMFWGSLWLCFVCSCLIRLSSCVSSWLFSQLIGDVLLTLLCTDIMLNSTAYYTYQYGPPAPSLLLGAVLGWPVQYIHAQNESSI